MSGFFDYKILPINFAGGGGRTGGEGENNNGPDDGGQPVANFLAQSHRLIVSVWMEPRQRRNRETAKVRPPKTVKLIASRFAGGLFPSIEVARTWGEGEF